MAHSVGPASNGKSPLRILVADGHGDCAESLAILLRLWGHQVTIASNGADAYAIALAQCPHALIADIILPQVNGFELAQRLCRRMALIALTGLGQEPFRRQGEAAGFHFYLVKPVDPEELYRVLEDIREGKR